jgi:hypothetical protein
LLTQQPQVIPVTVAVVVLIECSPSR